MKDLLKAYYDYIEKKYYAEAGFHNVEKVKIINCTNQIGIQNLIICSSINKAGLECQKLWNYMKTL